MGCGAGDGDRDDELDDDELDDDDAIWIAAFDEEPLDDEDEDEEPISIAPPDDDEDEDDEDEDDELSDDSSDEDTTIVAARGGSGCGGAGGGGVYLYIMSSIVMSGMPKSFAASASRCSCPSVTGVRRSALTTDRRWMEKKIRSSFSSSVVGRKRKQSQAAHVPALRILRLSGGGCGCAGRRAAPAAAAAAGAAFAAGLGALGICAIGLDASDDAGLTLPPSLTRITSSLPPAPALLLDSPRLELPPLLLSLAKKS